MKSPGRIKQPLNQHPLLVSSDRHRIAIDYIIANSVAAEDFDKLDRGAMIHARIVLKKVNKMMTNQQLDCGCTK